MDADVVRKMRSIFRKKEEAPSSDNSKENNWTKIRAVLMKVLGRFPEAKAAVVEGLAELSAQEGPVNLWAT